MLLFSGSANKPLAEKIAKALGIPLMDDEIFIFPDGERRVRILEEVVGKDCVIVQPTAPPVDTNYMELFFLVDACKRSGAKSVTAVVPYLGYQRQDHVFRDGEAVSLEVVHSTLESTGLDKLIVFDLHTPKTPDIFTIPVVHLSALPLFAQKITEMLGASDPVSLKGTTGIKSIKGITSKNIQDVSYPSPQLSPLGRGEDLNASRSEKTESTFSSFSDGNLSPSNTILISPDMGGVRRIKIMSELLNNMPYAAINKDRDLATGIVESNEIEGLPTNHQFKTAIIVDDMISSGGTIVAAAELLQKHAVEKIFVFATHAVFSEEAPETLQRSKVEKVFVTDSIYIPRRKHFPKLQVVSIAEMIAKELKGE